MEVGGKALHVVTGVLPIAAAYLPVASAEHEDVMVWTVSLPDYMLVVLCQYGRSRIRVRAVNIPSFGVIPLDGALYQGLGKLHRGEAGAAAGAVGQKRFLVFELQCLAVVREIGENGVVILWLQVL
jgi:hypothetical protein